MEILQSVSTTVRFPEPSDDPVTLTEPTVTITRDSDGATVLAEAETTTVEAEESGEHFTVEVAASKIPECDLLTATWTDGTNSYEQRLEVVGGNVISLAKIETQFGGEPTTANLEAMREQATREIESACGAAFRPRYVKQQLDGAGTKRLMLAKRVPLRLVRIEVAEEALSEAELEEITIDPIGAIERGSIWPKGKSNIEVAYVHRHSKAPEAEIPVRDYAAYLLTPKPTDWNERATSVQSDAGLSYSLITPGVRGARFPLPSVNAFVNQFSEALVG